MGVTDTDVLHKTIVNLPLASLKIDRKIDL